MIKVAKKDMDDITKKEVTFNDVSLGDLEQCRVFSGPFDVTYPADNVFNALPGFTRAVSDAILAFSTPFTQWNIQNTYPRCLLLREN